MTRSPPYVNPAELALLDWYAGCALPGLIADPHADHSTFEEVSQDAFDIAREMLKARSRHVPREAVPTEEPTP
jgi:hypothetical protein